jgi:ribonuclease R
MENMQTLGERCSTTERRADEATRDVTDWLKCEYMMDKVGESFDGIVTSVLSFGLFVELNDIYVEGLVHITSLRNDYYHFDAAKHTLSGEHTRKSYRLGDTVRVQVVRVDLDDKKIDFEMLDDEGESLPSQRPARGGKGRGGKGGSVKTDGGKAGSRKAGSRKGRGAKKAGQASADETTGKKTAKKKAGTKTARKKSVKKKAAATPVAGEQPAGAKKKRRRRRKPKAKSGE